MKRRVNLFNASLLPKKQRLSLTNLAIVLVVTLVGLVAGQVFLGQQIDRNQDLISDYERQNKRMQSQIETLSEQVAARKPDQSLAQQIELLTRQSQALTELADELDNRSVMANPGFSNLMRDLAEASDNQVWLQHFKLAEEGVSMKGMAQTADAVPNWLHQLGQKPSLQGQSLSEFRLTGELNGPFSFAIGHELKEPQS